MADYPEPADPVAPALSRRTKRSLWQRIFGEPQSWRRMIALGVLAGFAFAVVGALIAAGFGDGGSNSLDERPEPTAAAPVSTDDAPVIEEPTDVPVEQPTDVPVDEPTQEPIATELPPTDVPIEEPTPTEPPIAEPTPVQTVVGGA